MASTESVASPDGEGPASRAVPGAGGAPGALDPGALRRGVDPAALGFATTADLAEAGEDGLEPIGQERAVEAIAFAIGMRRPGYNLYALGRPGTGKHVLLRDLLGRAARASARPSDWCYVNNFDDPRRPLPLELPAGQAARLASDVEKLIDDLTSAVPTVFEGQEYRVRVEQVEEELEERQEKAIEALRKEADGEGVALLRTPTGFAVAPHKDGEVIEPDDFAKLSEEERERYAKASQVVQEKLKDIIRRLPDLGREGHRRVKQINRELTLVAVGPLLGALKERYAALPAVLAFLEALEKDVIENVDDFLPTKKRRRSRRRPLALDEPSSLERYGVNVIVDNGALEGAPVIYADNPSHQNLVGRVEHRAELGALVTDFNLIRAGDLHRARGGYLIVDALKVLSKPFAWEALKRALRTREVRIEPLADLVGIPGAASLEPGPVGLDDVKVVLVGDRDLYYLLYELDPDFPELFRIAADFEDATERGAATLGRYAALVASLARRDGLRPFDREAVARVIEQASREADDREKLTLQMRWLTELLHEADHAAGTSGSAVVGRAAVDRAVAARVRRADRLRERLQELVRRDVLRIETGGARIGQVNALSVLTLGGFAFGHPARVSATVRAGDGRVVDIEREVELGGPSHSKGVLILSAFLGARFGLARPLSLSAALVFEQHYGPIDGDSASLAELCALISAIARAPIEQRLAVTGSVDQHGRVQAIGGVNEKVEGFFDVCAARGLDGGHGVLVPRANVQHLMLDERVVAAAREGRFAVFAVETVEEAIALLTTRAAGEREPGGAYPPGSVFRAVEERLRQLAEVASAGGGRGERSGGERRRSDGAGEGR